MKKMIFGLFAALLLFAGCDTGTTPTVSYYIGSTGPGGGVVFYDDSIGYDFNGDGTVQEDEKNLMTEYRFLEAAPSGWNGGSGDPTAEWGAYGTDIPALDNVTDSNPDTLAGTVGDGKDSTDKIVNYLSGGSETGRAAQLASDYEGGGKSDWFLPSVGELLILHSEKDTVGGFSTYYWSSSEDNSNSAWSVRVHFGSVHDDNYKDDDYSYDVRPVRAFN